MKSQADWETHHQPYELAYHRDTGIGWCSDDARFVTYWKNIFDFIGLNPKVRDYHSEMSGHLLDIGCGPRPPFQVFTELGEYVHVIEPLASEYQRLTPEAWWRNIEVFSFGAERFVPELAGKMDVVMCWNCLDHTIGWKQILDNALGYMAPDGIFVLGTDAKPPHLGHPSFPAEELQAALEERFEFVKTRTDFSERQFCYVLTRKKI